MQISLKDIVGIYLKELRNNSTSHPRRTNHFKGNENSDFNSTSYSKEELVAEIEVAFLNNCTDILIDDT